MPIPDVESVTQWTIVATAALFAAWQTYTAQKAKAIAVDANVKAQEAASAAQAAGASDLNKSNLDLAEAYRLKANEWKDLCAASHSEFEIYRQRVHDKNEKDQAVLLKLTDENAQLRGRTDLTPIMKHMTEQSEFTKELSITLIKLTTAVEILVKRLNGDKPDANDAY